MVRHTAKLQGLAHLVSGKEPLLKVAVGVVEICSVAKTPVYPQVPAHAPIWLNLCMPLLSLPAGCGTPLRNRAFCVSRGALARTHLADRRF